MTNLVEAAGGTLRGALADAALGLVGREVVVELVALAAVAGEHVLIIGPPGTAKSEAVRRVAAALGGTYFEYLLGRFTEPSEVFGPIDLRKLREGRVETETAGMLPEADVAFLDEVFLGSTAILNTLLGVLNERTFRRGHTSMPCPLRVCVGASNALPADEALAAFADRFLLRLFLEPVPDTQLEELLAGGASLWAERPARKSSLDDLEVLTRASRSVELAGVRPHLAHAVRVLRKAGIALSDRRVVRVQRLIAAAAALAGRSIATRADLWPLVFAIPEPEAQLRARELLRDLLVESESRHLPTAALDASQGPKARARVLAEAGAAALAARPEDSDAEASGIDAWRLRLESVAREIDAGFGPETLTPELQQLRVSILEAVRA